MNKDTMFKVLAVVAILLIGMASFAMADNQGDVLMKNRYGTLSTTPVTDLDKLNGVSSNVQDQLDATTSSSLADTKVNVGQSTGLAAAKAISLTGDVTGTLANTGAMATSMAVNTVDSAEIVANAVSQSELNYEELDWYIEVGNSNAIATSTGLLMGQPYAMANVGDIGNDMINGVIYHTSDIEIVINGTAAGDAIHYRGMAIK